MARPQCDTPLVGFQNVELMQFLFGHTLRKESSLACYFELWIHFWGASWNISHFQCCWFEACTCQTGWSHYVMSCLFLPSSDDFEHQSQRQWNQVWVFSSFSLSLNLWLIYCCWWISFSFSWILLSIKPDNGTRILSSLSFGDARNQII